MSSITRIQTLINVLQSPSDQTQSQPKDPLATLEHFIDKMVTVENNIAKSDAQKAIQKAQILEEFQRKVAFLSGQIQKAESDLAAFESSLRQASNTPADNQLLDSKKREVLYWKAQLRQVCSPDGVL